MQYEDVSSASFLNSATVGIENTEATDGAQVAFNTAYVKDNFALRFMPPAPIIPFITNVSPTSGSLGEEGEEDTILVTLDATALAPEVYLQDLVLSSNSTDVTTTSATFELTVVGEPEFDNLPDSDVNLGLVDDATLSGSVVNGRGNLSEILYDPIKEDYFTNTSWNEYGVGFRENLGRPGPNEGFEWRVDWETLKAFNYITFGGTYTNQPQPNAVWEISYLSQGVWYTLEEGVGGWIDSGIYEYDGLFEKPVVAKALRVRIYSDGVNDLVSIHLRGRGGVSFGVDDSDTFPKATLIQYLQKEPKADFDFSTSFLEASFDGSSSRDIDGTIVDYVWDFGDGSTGSGEMTSHTYATPGIYDVNLMITDNDGFTDNITKAVLIIDESVCEMADNETDVDINLALLSEATLSGSVVGGRGSLEEILYDPRKNDYFIRTPWNEYGVGFRENLGRPGPDEGFIWRVD